LFQNHITYKSACANKKYFQQLLVIKFNDANVDRGTIYKGCDGMDSCLLTMMIGEEGTRKLGIKPVMILMFIDAKKPYWIKKQCAPHGKDKEAMEEFPEPEIDHYPDSNELTYIITDALLRYKPEISANYRKIRELFDKIEASAGISIVEFFRDYRSMKHHKESRRILSLLREELENSKLELKLVITVLVGGPSDQVTENLLRMNAPFELAITSKYRLKDKDSIEESL